MTKPNLHLKNPSLTLYAFHLRSDAMAEVVADAPDLWEKLAQLGDYFAAPELRQLPAQLICYQNGHYYPEGEFGKNTHYLELMPQRKWHFSSVLQDNLTRRGWVYPLRLHDTYAVDFTVYYPNQTIAIEHLRQLNPQDCLNPNFIQASLGHTLLFYAESLSHTFDDRVLANCCVEALFTETASISLSRRGQLFGSPIFEYEVISPTTHPNRLLHLLVWLGKHERTLALAGQANRWLINLLNCRHKILLADYQAKDSYHAAHKIYRQLESDSQPLDQLPTEPAKRLELLETILNQTSDNTFKYAHQFRDLADQHTTLTTNIANYAKWLRHLSDYRLPTDDLTWLADFEEKTSHISQQQITVYLDYLKPGHHLFEQRTATILGLVHLGEQKQQMMRAEKFEFLITFFGAAVGTGAISATVIPNPPHLSDLMRQLFELFEFIKIPGWFYKDPLVQRFSELPIFQWLKHFPALPSNISKVMFHLMVGGAAATFITVSISWISKWFTRDFKGEL